MNKKAKKIFFLLGLTLFLSVIIITIWIAQNNDSLEPFNTPLLKVSQIREVYTKVIEPPKITLSFVGDIMLSRGVARRITINQDNLYPFKNVQETLRKADIVFGNLESPIVDGPIVLSGEMRLRADIGMERALKEAGFTVLSLANNHIGDFGQNGVLKTLELLNSVGIKHTGAGLNESEAYEPVYIDIKGYRFAFLAYNDSDVVHYSYRASSDRAGSAFMEILLMQEKVREAQTIADFVIVSMHSGDEYTDRINTRQRNFAYSAIDAGADIVVGHHPHIVQEVEIYKNKYIFYSLGNFIFDQLEENTKEGVIVTITLVKNEISDIEYLATYIENYSQPRIITDEAHSKRVLDRLKLPQTI